MRRAVQGHAGRLRQAETILDGKDPVKILQRGYAIVTTVDGHTVTDADTIGTGTQIRARLAHGTLVARVETKETNGRE